MSVTYDISTDRGKLRFRLGDTNAAAPVFTDAEIDYLLTTGGSVFEGLKLGVQQLITSRAYRIKRATSLNLTIDDTEQVAQLRAWLNDLGGVIPEATVTFPKRLPSDSGFDTITYS